jgi:murein DD-endopeptidase MepM/ murein hydrolase activator NlpD
MKKYASYMILAIFLSSCATLVTYGPFSVNKTYGDSAPYGEGIHPGIDFAISTGTPIIAVSDGNVNYIGEIQGRENGIFVSVWHRGDFRSLYGHLSKVFVMKGQMLERGQLIGLSGASNNYGAIDHQHLHFGLCKTGQDCINYSKTYDPKMFWLRGQPQCFDPKMDYSVYSQKEITLPVACGEYGKALIAESKRKD